MAYGFTLAAWGAALLAPFSALAGLLLLPAAGRGLWRSIPRGALTWIMFGWCLWLPVTLGWSLSVGLALPQIAVLLCLPLGWLAGLALEREGMAHWLMPGLQFTLIVLVLWGIVQGPNTATVKPQGPFNDPNTYAAVLNLVALPILARWLAANLESLARWRRVTMLSLLAAMVFMSFMVASRGASLAIAVVLLPLLWLARSQPGYVRKLLLLAVVLLVAYFAAGYVTGYSLGVRMVDTLKHGDPSRIMLMRSALLMIADAPLLGTGLASFRLLYPAYRFPSEGTTGGSWVHNDYLQLWLEAGLPMLAIVLGLVAWTAWKFWRTLCLGGGAALERAGYLAAILAVLFHALFNFLLFFALISLLLGLYLAQVSMYEASVAPTKAINAARPVRLMAAGYVLIVGWLLLGLVAVEGLLGQAYHVRRAMLHLGASYPIYDVAYWLSVMSPFHSAPSQAMGQQLTEGFHMTGGTSIPLREAALARMEDGWRKAPCLMSYANDALILLRGEKMTPEVQAHSERILARSLACNARHGLSYYHAGLFALKQGKENVALQWWNAGLRASRVTGDHLLLTAAILSRMYPSHRLVLGELSIRMAEALERLEADPSKMADQAFWSHAQHLLWSIAGRKYLELMAAAA